MSRSGKVNLAAPVAILAVLAIISFIVFRSPADNAGGEGAGPDNGQQGLAAGMLVDAERDAISRLDVKTPKGESYSLMKHDDNWFALKDGAEYPADEARTASLLDMLPELRSEAMMSDKPEHHPTFELNEDQAYSLAVYAGGSDPKVTLLVGKSTENVKGCFVRLAGEDSVYKASANLRTALGYSFDDYRSKQLWQYDPLLATHVTVTPVLEDGSLTGEPQAFSRDGEFWTIDGAGGNGNQNDLKELVDRFSGLRIQTFIDDPSTLPAEQFNPEATPCLTVEAAGKSYTLTIHGNEEGNIVVSDTDGRVYKTSRSNLGFLLDQDFTLLSFYQEPVPEPSADGDAAGTEADADAEGMEDEGSAAGGE
ncbi:DUF4340 domain-containing protein [bacterium]|nr:DUF4340 domain-containing protein [bacterium]